MYEKLNLPKFASETEEAQWWFDHRDAVAQAFEDAGAKGQLRTGSVASLAEKENADAGALIPLRLDPEDISRAKTLAAQRGLRYQGFLQMLVHEALAAEERRLL